jgi:nicotinamide riboside kinase
MIRVVLTGSESTGKTTLAQRIAEHYQAEFVPEFVREYAAKKGAPLDFSDHGPIAKGQMALEDAAIARKPRLIVQDTDLLSTVVYCDHYFGNCPPWIAQNAVER